MRGIQTRGSRVRSVNTSSILCRPPASAEARVFKMYCQVQVYMSCCAIVTVKHTAMHNPQYCDSIYTLIDPRLWELAQELSNYLCFPQMMIKYYQIKK